MASKFVISAELNLQGVTGLKEAQTSIKKGLAKTALQIDSITVSQKAISQAQRAINKAVSANLNISKIRFASTALNNLSKQLQGALSKPINIGSINLGKAGFANIARQINQGLANRTITVSQLAVSRSAVNSLARSISAGLANARFTLPIFNVRQNVVSSILSQIRNQLRTAPPVTLNIRANVLGTTRSISGSGGGNAIRQIRADLTDANSALAQFGTQAGFTFKRFLAYKVTTDIFFSISRSIGAATEKFLEFDRELRRAQQVTQESEIAVQSLSQAARDIGKNYGTSSLEILKSATTLAQAGIPLKEVQDIIKVIGKTDLAPTFTSIKNTTEAVIAIKNQFKLSTSEIERSLGSVNKVAADFAVESDDILEAVRRVGGVFAQTNNGVEDGVRNFQQLIAVFTAVRQTTRESAEAISTGLRNIFTRLQRPKTLEYLDDLNIRLRDARGEFIGIFPALEKLNSAFKQLEAKGDTSTKFAILEEIAGSRNLSRALPAINQVGTARSAYFSGLLGENSLNAEKGIAGKSLQNQVKRLGETFFDTYTEIANNDSVKKTAQSFIDLSSSILTLTKNLAGLTPVLASLGVGFGLKALQTTLFNFGKGFFGASLPNGTRLSPNANSKYTASPSQLVQRASLFQGTPRIQSSYSAISNNQRFYRNAKTSGLSSTILGNSVLPDGSTPEAKALLGAQTGIVNARNRISSLQTSIQSSTNANEILTFKQSLLKSARAISVLETTVSQLTPVVAQQTRLIGGFGGAVVNVGRGTRRVSTLGRIPRGLRNLGSAALRHSPGIVNSLSTAALLGTSFLDTEQTPDLSNSSSKRIKASLQGAGFGSFSGAFVGTQLAGPIGGTVGALGGAIGGFISAFDRATREIESIKIDRSLSELSGKFSTLREKLADVINPLERLKIIAETFGGKDPLDEVFKEFDKKRNQNEKEATFGRDVVRGIFSPYEAVHRFLGGNPRRFGAADTISDFVGLSPNQENLTRDTISDPALHKNFTEAILNKAEIAASSGISFGDFLRQNIGGRNVSDAINLLGKSNLQGTTEKEKNAEALRNNKILLSATKEIYDFKKREPENVEVLRKFNDAAQQAVERFEQFSDALDNAKDQIGRLGDSVDYVTKIAEGGTGTPTLLGGLNKLAPTATGAGRAGFESVLKGISSFGNDDELARQFIEQRNLKPFLTDVFSSIANKTILKKEDYGDVGISDEDRKRLNIPVPNYESRIQSRFLKRVDEQGFSGSTKLALQKSFEELGQREGGIEHFITKAYETKALPELVKDFTRFNDDLENYFHDKGQAILSSRQIILNAKASADELTFKNAASLDKIANIGEFSLTRKLRFKSPSEVGNALRAFSDNQFNVRQQRLGGAIGLNAGALSTQALAAQREAISLREKLRDFEHTASNEDEFNRLSDSFLLAQRKAANLREALEGLTDSQARLAGVSKQLAEVESERAQKAALAEHLLTGGPDAQAQFRLGQNLARFVNEKGEFQGGIVNGAGPRGKAGFVSAQFAQANILSNPDNVKALANYLDLTGKSETKTSLFARLGGFDASKENKLINEAEEIENSAKTAIKSLYELGQASIANITDTAKASKVNFELATATIYAKTVVLSGEIGATHAAMGGLMKSRGTDTVPAMLSPGEYIVNAKSASSNRALLEHVNKARGPIYRADGGLAYAPSNLDNMSYEQLKKQTDSFKASDFGPDLTKLRDEALAKQAYERQQRINSLVKENQEAQISRLNQGAAQQSYIDSLPNYGSPLDKLVNHPLDVTAGFFHGGADVSRAVVTTPFKALKAIPGIVKDPEGTYYATEAAIKNLPKGISHTALSTLDSSSAPIELGRTLGSTAASSLPLPGITAAASALKYTARGIKFGQNTSSFIKGLGVLGDVVKAEQAAPLHPLGTVSHQVASRVKGTKSVADAIEAIALQAVGKRVKPRVKLGDPILGRVSENTLGINLTSNLGNAAKAGYPLKPKIIGQLPQSALGPLTEAASPIRSQVLASLESGDVALAEAVRPASAKRVKDILSVLHSSAKAYKTYGSRINKGTFNTTGKVSGLKASGLTKVAESRLKQMVDTTNAIGASHKQEINTQGISFQNLDIFGKAHPIQLVREGLLADYGSRVLSHETGHSLLSIVAQELRQGGLSYSKLKNHPLKHSPIIRAARLLNRYGLSGGTDPIKGSQFTAIHEIFAILNEFRPNELKYLNPDGTNLSRSDRILKLLTNPGYASKLDPKTKIFIAKFASSLEAAGYATGGHVRGASDTVPAWLTPGEFVVKKGVAQRNKALLESMNNGYESGGEVEPKFRIHHPHKPLKSKFTGTKQNELENYIKQRRQFIDKQNGENAAGQLYAAEQQRRRQEYQARQTNARANFFQRGFGLTGNRFGSINREQIDQELIRRGHNPDNARVSPENSAFLKVFIERSGEAAKKFEEAFKNIPREITMKVNDVNVNLGGLDMLKLLSKEATDQIAQKVYEKLKHLPNSEKARIFKGLA